MTYSFFRSCVDWPRDNVHTPGGLCDLIDQRREISQRTFVAHIDPDDLRIMAEQLGYSAHRSQGLTMAGDLHVEYFRSKWLDPYAKKSRRVYGFRWSAIEHVFLEME